MVLALTIVRGLDGVGYVYDHDRRYNVYAMWFSLKLFQPLLMWWSIWGLRDVQNWNFLAFVLGVGGPTFLYLQMSTLMPRMPGRVTDWRAHFFRVKRRFFLANIAVSLCGPLQLLSLGSPEYGAPLLIGAGGEIVLSVVALRSRSDRVHMAIACLVGLGFLVWSLLLYRPLSLFGA